MDEKPVMDKNIKSKTAVRTQSARPNRDVKIKKQNKRFQIIGQQSSIQKVSQRGKKNRLHFQI